MATVGEREVGAVREFNRFYTVRLGLLQRRHLDGDFSLTEARVLYEIWACPGVTASSLRKTLGLDGGYVSRILRQLGKRGLVQLLASPRDGREKLLLLSKAGGNAVDGLNAQSDRQIQSLLGDVHASDRGELLESFAKIRSLLTEPIRVARLLSADEDVLGLLEEYYEAVSVVRRDGRGAIQRIIDEDGSGVWVAYLGKKAVGCVMLRRMESIALAGECKRLYVQPAARGLRIADRLLDAQEEYARKQGMRWIYLDSYDGLKVAIALYRRRGYVSCERYNDNPQATVFLRKEI